MHRPQRWRTVAEATPARTGVLRARLLRPAGVTRCSSSLLESGSDAVYVGRVESAPLMAGAVGWPAQGT